MPPTRIVLVRHGEAVAGVERIVGGEKGCRGLTDTGRAQAAALRDRLARTGELAPGVVYASDLPRARQTAEIACEAFAKVEIRTGREFRELEPGECDGMPYDEAVARFAPLTDGPDDPMSPGGETTREFDTRIRATMHALVTRHPGETVMVFSHGGFVAGACVYALGAPGLADAYPFRLWPANTSLTCLRADTEVPPWLLERYNDVAHVGEPIVR